MKGTKEAVLTNFQAMLGEENVITERESILDYDSDNRAYAKAFGVYREVLPMCILRVFSTEQIVSVVRYCSENEISIIARTGQSSFELLLTAVKEDTIVLDASAMNQILKVDTDNMMVTVQCGVNIGELEDLLNEKGYTTGHCPQSKPGAQMGGLVATRSIGQLSNYYGGIEDMVCGLEAVLSDGEIIRIRSVPRRAAGPDLRHILIGSEGAIAVITEVTVKIFPYYPEGFWKCGYIVPSFHAGLQAIRDIYTAGYKPSVIRLYDKGDFDHAYGSVELKEDEAYMFFMAEGPVGIPEAIGAAVDSICRSYGCTATGSAAVDHWLEHRFDHFFSLYKTEKRKQRYHETHTYDGVCEVSAAWSELSALYDNVIARLGEEIDNLVYAGGHLSHCQQNGANVYFVYRLLVHSPETFAEEQQAVVNVISEESLKFEHGSCVHHHSMGKMRIGFAEQEHGSSYEIMKRIKSVMDPKGIMNPGNLVAVASD